MDQPSEELVELIDSLKSNDVEFLVVGAHALAFYGLPRNTVDVDFWVRRSSENAKKIRRALQWFGIELGDEGEAQLQEDQQILQIGEGPGRVDILTFLSGCDFEEAWQRRVVGPFGPEQVQYLSLEDFIATKRASGRPKDLLDLLSVQEILGQPDP